MSSAGEDPRVAAESKGLRPDHVILDRDGVLNQEDPGGTWISTPEQWSWLAGARDGLRRLAEAGIRVSVATNQSCIGRGVVSAEAVAAVNDHMRREAAAAGGPIAQVFVCPHAPDDGCDCRKPRGGLVQQALSASAIAAERTVLIGDAERDLLAGLECGLRVFLVRTGKGATTEQALGSRSRRLPSVPVYDDLLSAVDHLLQLESMPTAQDIFEDIFEDSVRVLTEAARTVPEALSQAAALCLESLQSGGKVLTCGNGGSAADAQHLAAELVGRFRHERAALAALALTTDTSALTAIANDYGFERIFARQVEALASSADVLIVISTSGRSPNVVAAAQAARARGCRVVALTGESGGELAELADVLVAVPSQDVPRIQEVHAVCVHALAEILEQNLLSRSDGDP